MKKSKKGIDKLKKLCYNAKVFKEVFMKILKKIAAVSCASLGFFSAFALGGCGGTADDSNVADNSTVVKEPDVHFVLSMPNAYVLVDDTLHKGDVYQINKFHAGFGASAADLECVEGKSDVQGYNISAYSQKFPVEEIPYEKICKQCFPELSK